MLQSSNRGLGVLTLLSWLAACEGGVSKRQLQLLRQVAERQNDASIFELALQAAMSNDAGNLASACMVVKRMPRKSRHTFVQWAFAIATADKRLSIGANFALRFLIDLVEIDFNEACRRAGKTLPSPSNVSSLRWWRIKESSSQDSPHGGQKTAFERHINGMTVAQACAILQLGPNPTHAEVSRAFRRLASLHHPDRHAGSGADERRSAAKKFARVRRAFQLLRKQ